MMKNMLGDLQIVVERHSDVLRNNALPFRILIALRIFGFLVSPLSSFFGFFSLLPIQLFSIEIWRLVSCAFVGKNLLLLSWTLFSLHFGTNLIRQASTNEALLKTFAVTQLLSTLVVSLFAFLFYLVAGHTTLLYSSPLVDMVPLNTAVLVLIKQFLPDSIVFATPLGRLKYTHLPLSALALAILAALVGLVTAAVPLQVLVSIQVSWTYLRFFNPHETDAIYGDNSDHFTWASLFPRHIQPICTVVGRIFFRSLVRFGVCKRQVRHVDLISLQTVPISLPGLDSSARDADRRRQKALRDLNERLKKTKRVETALDWEEEDETEGGAEGEKVKEEVSPSIAATSSQNESSA